MRLKLRKIGNSLGVLLPRNVITGLIVGDSIDVNVITKGENVITNDKVLPEKEEKGVITTENVITNDKPETSGPKNNRRQTGTSSEPFISYFKG